MRLKTLIYYLFVFPIVAVSTLLCSGCRELEGEDTGNLERGELTSVPRRLLELSPNDSVDIQMSGDRLIVRAYHYQQSEDFSMSSSIYSVDLEGKDPQLLSSDLDDVLVLKDGTVLGYDYPGWTQIGSVYYLDPTGQSAPVLLVENVFATTMTETPYGIVIMGAIDDSDYRASLQFFPFYDTGIGPPETLDYEFQTFWRVFTDNKRHLMLKEASEGASKRLFWVDLATFEDRIVEADVIDFEAAPSGPYVVWSNSAGELHLLDTETGETRLLLGEDDLEFSPYTGEYYFPIRFTKDGRHLIFSSGYLLELSSGNRIDLPEYASFDEELGIVDGKEWAFGLIEDGSIMLGRGEDPNVLQWSRFDTTGYTNTDMFEPMNVFAEFSYHEGRIYAVEPLEMTDSGDGRMLRSDLSGKESYAIGKPVNLKYEWLGANRLITHTNGERFSVQIKDNSSVSMEKAELRLIDLKKQQYYILDEMVHPTSTTVFSDRGIIAYTVADHDDLKQSGLYIIKI